MGKGSRSGPDTGSFGFKAPSVPPGGVCCAAVFLPHVDHDDGSHYAQARLLYITRRGAYDAPADQRNEKDAEKWGDLLRHLRDVGEVSVDRNPSEDRAEHHRENLGFAEAARKGQDGAETCCAPKHKKSQGLSPPRVLVSTGI